MSDKPHGTRLADLEAEVATLRHDVSVLIEAHNACLTRVVALEAKAVPFWIVKKGTLAAQTLAEVGVFDESGAFSGGRLLARSPCDHSRVVLLPQAEGGGVLACDCGRMVAVREADLETVRPHHVVDDLAALFRRKVG